MNGGRFLLLLCLPGSLSLSSCSMPDDGVTVQGAGATFPAPLYKRWFLEYYKLHHNVRTNYQAIGSGAGIRQFSQGLTAFGASDAGMSKDEVAKFRKAHDSDVLLVPMTAGSIALCYNVPGVAQGLKLTRKAYMRIFKGEITNWNDPDIAEANPKLMLPNLDLKVVRRADGSGTTYAFTNHLVYVGNNISIPWLEKSPNKSWPRQDMIGGRGNPGVAALIQQTPGAIGYLETGYAELSEPPLPMAALQNKTGNFVIPSPESSQASLKNATLPPDFRISVPDPDAKEGYPIVTYTWLLCYQDYSKFRGPRRTGKTLKELIHFCLTDGQKYSDSLGYIPIPADISKQILAAVDKIKTGTEN